MDIGNRIKFYRKVKGYTLKELAEIIGVTYPYISDMENNKKSPSMETLQKLSNALETPVYAFFTDSEVENVNSSIPLSPETLIEQARTLFMSEFLSAKDKDTVFKDITDAFFESKGVSTNDKKRNGTGKGD
jgi:transcriptional regulator with XRE-family HTH domain